MKDRDEILKSIRIKLNLEKDTSAKQELINFQNETLRPILKFQNQLLVLLFQAYIKDRKFKWQTSIDFDRKEFISKALSNDKHIKSTFIGCVIAHFTNSEIMFYTENQHEINKRIISMSKQRLFDQL